MDQPGAGQKPQAGTRPGAGLNLVSYILVNWNTEAFLSEALRSILDQTHKQNEIILINNASPGPDGQGFRPTALPVKPDVYINNRQNIGFAAANNQGIAAASGDVIILLNCDARLHPDFTRNALKVLAANPRIGSVVCKQFVDDESGILESTGHIMYTGRTAVNRGRGELDQGQYDQGGFVFGGNAAAIAYRREMLDQLAQRTVDSGLATQRAEVFDESFFAYFEDVDLDWRAQLCGWLAYYEPGCIAWHKVHGSGGRKRWKIRMLAEKNRYLMLAKNDTLAGQLRAALPLFAYECLHALRVLATPYLWPAAVLYLWHLPGALAARFTAGPHRSVAPARVEAQFRPYGLRPPPEARRPDGSPGSAEPGGAAGDGGLVSIVVLNWNGLSMTRRCLDSILAQSYEDIEIVVVDNGSDADEAEVLRMDLGIRPGETAQIGRRRVRVLRLPRNQGFAGGVNWGLPQTQGEYIVLVNNDCVLDQDCIKRLVYAARSSGADAISGRLVNIGDVELIAPAVRALRLELEEDPEDVVWDMPARLAQAIQESYRNHGTTLFGYRAGDLYPPTDPAQLGPGTASLKPAFYPSGGLCLITREVVDDLAPELFPTLFFAYHEDNFLGNHLRATGRSIVKEPRAAAVHLHNATSRSLGKVRLRFYQERNRLMRMLIWQPASVLLRLWPIVLLQHMLGYFWTLLRQPLEWPGLMLAHLWVLFHLPTVAQMRRRYRSQMKVADRKVLQEMSGRLRGEGGLFNAVTVAWCRALGIPCFETSGRRTAPAAGTVQSQHE
ncbi:glycosyltransferase family 2 protein [bacterium]|nr:glycosyltransferase family 2 protein [bacterium]